MQKYTNLQKNPLKETKILQDIITLSLISSFNTSQKKYQLSKVPAGNIGNGRIRLPNGVIGERTKPNSHPSGPSNQIKPPHSHQRTIALETRSDSVVDEL
jgi:hypothetical protein